MKLEEYLQEKLNVTKEEADKIVGVFHSYKSEHAHSHGNHQHHEMRENSNQDIYSKIYESKEYCESVNYNLDKLHCNCCHNNCTLSSPNCGRGQMVQEEIQNEFKQ